MSVIERVRRSDHTGDRRCWPCTAVNAVLLAVAVVAVAAWRPLAAVPVAALGGAGIWLRGYLVPYTPAFAPRLVRGLGLDDYFHHRPPGGAPDGAEGPDTLARGNVDGETLLGELVDAGVLAAEGDHLALDPGFDEAWRAEMAALRALETGALTDAVAEEALAADARTVRDEIRDSEWVVLSDGSGGFEAETWLSRPVAVAEAAAARALEGRVDEGVRLPAAGSLRMFLEECPDCGATLVESTTASCCGGYTDPTEAPDEVIACPDCDARLYTFEDRAA